MLPQRPLTPKRLLVLLGTAFLFFLALIISLLMSPQKAQNVPQVPTVALESPTAAFVSLISIIDTSTPTFLPTSVLDSTPTTIPDSFSITNITGHRQVYHLGCEASASVDWANYFGVTIYEYTFQTQLPHSDNPDYGFVGDVNSEWGQVPPYAYGVYAGPVADLLQKSYDLPAKAEKNYTLAEVKQQLADSKPVIVWIIGNMEWSPPTQYVDSEGRSTIVAAYEHVVILTGYDQDSITYMTNGRFFKVPTDVFLTSWGVLGNMAVIHD
jgi:uncharacterized protein YvpB